MRRLLLVAAASLVASTAAYAHHSYAATYDVTREVKLEGKHSFVHIMAADDKGVEQRWAVEWSGTTQLGSSGVNKETLKVGDHVIIMARPSRVPGEFRALMLTLKRPSDGFAWGSAGQTVD
jgi:hypothetical protein